MAIPAILREFGLDPDEVLAEFDIAPAHFEDPENTLPFTTVGRLLGRCRELTGCAHLGLLLGRRAGVSALGAVGYLMQSAPDVRTALGALVEFLHLHDRGASVSLSFDGDYSELGYAILQRGVPNSELILDAAMVIALNILRGMCGPDWTPTEVLLAHSRPKDAAPYRTAFGRLPRFDAPRSALVFPAKWLDHPIPGADPLLHKLMQVRIQELRLLDDDSLPGQLRRLLRQAIPGGDSSLEAVARRLGIQRPHAQPPPARRRHELRAASRGDPLRGGEPAPEGNAHARGPGGARAGLRRRELLHPRVPALVGDEPGPVASIGREANGPARAAQEGPEGVDSRVNPPRISHDRISKHERHDGCPAPPRWRRHCSQAAPAPPIPSWAAAPASPRATPRA